MAGLLDRLGQSAVLGVVGMLAVVSLLLRREALGAAAMLTMLLGAVLVARGAAALRVYVASCAPPDPLDTVAILPGWLDETTLLATTTYLCAALALADRLGARRGAISIPATVGVLVGLIGISQHYLRMLYPSTILISWLVGIVWTGAGWWLIERLPGPTLGGASVAPQPAVDCAG